MTPPTTAQQRVARTDSQAARGSGAVVLLVWLAGFVNVDLDPLGPGTELPLEVAVILAGLLTAGFARWMNRGPDPGAAPPVLLIGSAATPEPEQPGEAAP